MKKQIYSWCLHGCFQDTHFFLILVYSYMLQLKRPKKKCCFCFCQIWFISYEKILNIATKKLFKDALVQMLLFIKKVLSSVRPSFKIVGFEVTRSYLKKIGEILLFILVNEKNHLLFEELSSRQMLEKNKILLKPNINKRIPLFFKGLGELLLLSYKGSAWNQSNK